MLGAAPRVGNTKSCLEKALSPSHPLLWDGPALLNLTKTGCWDFPARLELLFAKAQQSPAWGADQAHPSKAPSSNPSKPSLEQLGGNSRGWELLISNGWTWNNSSLFGSSFSRFNLLLSHHQLGLPLKFRAGIWYKNPTVLSQTHPFSIGSSTGKAPRGINSVFLGRDLSLCRIAGPCTVSSGHIIPVGRLELFLSACSNLFITWERIRGNISAAAEESSGFMDVGTAHKQKELWANIALV